MKENDVRPDQAAKISKALFPSLNDLVRLKERMEKLFRPDDPLFRQVVAAYDAVFRLSVTVHYLSCTSGVGMPHRNQGGNAPAKAEGVSDSDGTNQTQ